MPGIPSPSAGGLSNSLPSRGKVFFKIKNSCIYFSFLKILFDFCIASKYLKPLIEYLNNL